MYKVQFSQLANEVVSVLRLSDMTSIPFDPANTDYQAYLKWLEEGNTPLPAVEPTPEPTPEEPVATEPTPEQGTQQ